MAEGVKGFLSETFNARTVAKVALWSIPMFFIFGYLDNSIFDPLFFDIIHGAELSPEMSQWKAAVENTLGWTHDIVGFTGDGGLLNTALGEWFLETFGGEYSITAGYDAPPPEVVVTPSETPSASGNNGTLLAVPSLTS